MLNSREGGKFTDLSFTLAEKGSSISQGQRQLVRMARVVLKGSKMVILDGATVSIDHESDLKIQACIRSMEATVITIAHRLRTVIDYDRILGLIRRGAREGVRSFVAVASAQRRHLQGHVRRGSGPRRVVYSFESGMGY